MTRHSSFVIDLRSSLLTLGIAQTSLALLSLNRSLLHSSFFILSFLLCCSSCRSSPTEKETSAAITEDMALEGISNYCHTTYDWSPAQDNPSLMSVTMGEESDSAYQVVFRSHTGALVSFYVDKNSGSTDIVERVPTLGIESEAGTIDLFDYLDRGE